MSSVQDIRPYENYMDGRDRDGRCRWRDVLGVLGPGGEVLVRRGGSSGWVVWRESGFWQ